MTRAKQAAEERKVKRDEISSKEKMHRQDIREKRFSTEAKLTTDAAKAAGTIAGAVAKFNHPEWYKKFITSDVNTQLPSYTRMGTRLTNGWMSSAGNVDNLPGIAVITYLSSLPNIGGIGYNFVNSPINVGLSRFMSELRKMNSRIGDYDPSDFGLYWYAAVDLMYVLIKIGKCLQIYNTYVAENAYFAEALIQAQGFSYIDFAANVQQYKALYKKYLAMFNSNVVIPKNLTFALRRLWMADLIIRDHKGPKSQLYIFRQAFWGTLAEDEGSVTYGSYTSAQTYLSVGQYLETGFSRLVDSQGIQTMIADLRAGIPGNSFLVLEPYDMNVDVTISDSDVDLEQIHNLTSMPLYTFTGLQGTTIYAMSNGYLAQGVVDSNLDQVLLPGPAVNYDANVIDLTDPSTITSLKSFYREHAILNFYKDTFTEDDVLEATRLRHTVEHYDSYPNALVANNRGTELVFYITLWHFNPVNKQLVATVLGTVGDYSADNLAFITRFDWFPLCRGTGMNNKVIISWLVYGEVDNYIPISPENLYNLHDQCGLSEFFISSTEFNRGFTR